jgi:hypothetical protein
MNDDLEDWTEYDAETLAKIKKAGGPEAFITQTRAKMKVLEARMARAAGQIWHDFTRDRYGR